MGLRQPNEIDLQELLDNVLDVLVQMPIDEAKATTLRYLGGMSMEEVAAELNIDTEQATQLACSGLRQLHLARVAG